jgi:hypothetical protein
MKAPSVQSFLFNAGGVFLIVTALGYAISAEFRSAHVKTCSARFKQGQTLGLLNAAREPLSPIELQARAGAREWGVLKNLKVLNKAAPGNGPALEVSLAATGNEDAPDQNGVGFAWVVDGLSKAQSGCLTYDAFIPADFSFAEPGYFPGLFGGHDVAMLDQQTPAQGFAARMGWANGGELGVEMRTPQSNGYWLGAAETSWPTGRWVRIEQEVQLNTPGEQNGVVRVWVDGEMKVEQKQLEIQGSDQIALAGVVSDIGYAHAASNPATLRTANFVVMWQ